MNGKVMKFIFSLSLFAAVLATSNGMYHAFYIRFLNSDEHFAGRF